VVAWCDQFVLRKPEIDCFFLSFNCLNLFSLINKKGKSWLIKNRYLLQGGHNWETQCCKFLTFRLKISVLLEFWFLRTRINFPSFFFYQAQNLHVKAGFQHECAPKSALLDVDIEILKASTFLAKKVWPYSLWFLSYDLMQHGFFFSNDLSAWKYRKISYCGKIISFNKSTLESLLNMSNVFFYEYFFIR